MAEISTAVLDDCKDKSGGAAGGIASSVSGAETGQQTTRRRQWWKCQPDGSDNDRVVGNFDTYSSLLALKALIITARMSSTAAVRQRLKMRPLE